MMKLAHTAKGLAGLASAAAFDPSERRCFARIEARRTKLARSTRKITLINGKTRLPIKLPALSPVWARRLFYLIRMTRPLRCLELGTSSGFSAAYQAAALAINGCGRLVTLEGAPEVAQLATANLAAIGLDNVRVETGFFADTLPGVLTELGGVDYAFIDGHHDKIATLAYFKLLVPSLSPGAVVVFDDITWSMGMRRAWSALQKHPVFRSTHTWGRMGLGVAQIE